MNVLLLLVSGHYQIKKMTCYNKHFKWKQHLVFLSCTMISYQDMTQLKEVHLTLDRSPEFCFQCIIYRYLLEMGHAPGDLSGGLFLVPVP